MDWKISLDRYLTTEPHDEFDSYCEDVFAEQFSSEFYNENDEWIEDVDGQCSKWLSMAFNKGYNTDMAAKIIERAHKIFIK